ncbi:unnamed protein product [Moneuplotes crassus]|uniref:Uncharacterized protein n=1 Tax=Euplotes crassus TaxID=5936 RepID=A0AAD1Y6R6_EUPCR|nr:unnamed protein product [Moneuplotes crassus]
MSQEDQKLSFGRPSYENRSIPRISRDRHLPGRVSEQVSSNKKFSQGGSNPQWHDNFTEDDIGNEGITELFNYLSDSESEEAKRYSVGLQRLPSGVKKLEEDDTKSLGGDTGTFPFERETESEGVEGNKEINLSKFNADEKDGIVMVDQKEREPDKDEDLQPSSPPKHLLKEEQKQRDRLENSEDQRLLEEFESRIRKTDSEEKRPKPPKQLDELVSEGEDSEEEFDETAHQIYQPKHDEYDNILRKKTFDPNLPPIYDDSDNENNEYHKYLAQIEAKAKKYKRKAKKLYSNLQKLKVHYEKAKRNVDDLSIENNGLRDQLIAYEDRLNYLHSSYGIPAHDECLLNKRLDSSSSDPLVHQLMKEIEFLKRENKRLTNHYLESIENTDYSSRDTESIVMVDQAREIERLTKDLGIRDLELNRISKENHIQKVELDHLQQKLDQTLFQLKNTNLAPLHFQNSSDCINRSLNVDNFPSSPDCRGHLLPPHLKYSKMASRMTQSSPSFQNNQPLRNVYKNRHYD